MRTAARTRLKWATLRSRNTHQARSSASLGMAENAKISAISATGGPQRANRRTGFDMTAP